MDKQKETIAEKIMQGLHLGNEGMLAIAGHAGYGTKGGKLSSGGEFVEFMFPDGSGIRMEGAEDKRKKFVAFYLLTKEEVQ